MRRHAACSLMDSWVTAFRKTKPASVCKPCRICFVIAFSLMTLRLWAFSLMLKAFCNSKSSTPFSFITFTLFLQSLSCQCFRLKDNATWILRRTQKKLHNLHEDERHRHARTSLAQRCLFNTWRKILIFQFISVAFKKYLI